MFLILLIQKIGQIFFNNLFKRILDTNKKSGLVILNNDSQDIGILYFYRNNKNFDNEEDAPTINFYGMINPFMISPDVISDAKDASFELSTSTFCYGDWSLDTESNEALYVNIYLKQNDTGKIWYLYAL